MSTAAEDDLRLTSDAFKRAFPSEKPHVTMRIFDDGNLQLNLSPVNVGATPFVSATGTGKTLEEAAAKLKTHFLSKLGEHMGKVKADFEAHVIRVNNILDNLSAAQMTCAGTVKGSWADSEVK